MMDRVIRSLSQSTALAGIALIIVAASPFCLGTPAFGDIILEDAFSNVQGANGFSYGALIAGNMAPLSWDGSRWKQNRRVPRIWKESGVVKMQSRRLGARWSVYSWHVPEDGDYVFDVTFSSQRETRRDIRNNVYVYVGDHPLDFANQLFVGEIRHMIPGYSVAYDTMGSPVTLTKDTEVHFAVAAKARKPVGLTGTIASLVPIPGTAWLLGFGLIGLVGFRRRTKKA